MKEKEKKPNLNRKKNKKIQKKNSTEKKSVKEQNANLKKRKNRIMKIREGHLKATEELVKKRRT